MKLFNVKNIFLSTSLLTLMACQPGAPVVTVLGEVSGFDISEKTQILKSKTNKNVFYISGTCFGAIKDVQISFDNGSSYSALSQYAETSTQNCSSSGTFSYKINPNNTVAFDIPANSSYKDFKIRGTSDFGPTSVQNLRRMISNSGDLQVTAGSTLASVTVSGTPAILRGRIVSSAGSVSGTNFILKGAIRIK
ncbi:hypothetical protein CIK05_13155 [Bdellovibrio sp. qaytius]|nr:hypothetical protein CIK05_13155 [Bdellovibrio sp. qaytius]